MLNAEGASPAVLRTFSQYSGSEVYWSQAITAHFSGFSAGKSISVGIKRLFFIKIPL